MDQRVEGAKTRSIARNREERKQVAMRKQSLKIAAAVADEDLRMKNDHGPN